MKRWSDRLWMGGVAALVVAGGLISCSSSDTEYPSGGGATGGAGATSSGGGGAGATSSGGSGATGAEGGAGAGGGTGGVGNASADLVMIGSYELEVAVNTSEPNQQARARWYGSLYPAEQDGIVTNVVVANLSFEEDGAQRSITALEMFDQDLAELPAIQERAWGVLTATGQELTLCSGGPGIHRGSASAPEIIIRMAGYSDQGPWAAEDTLTPTELMRTCHSGVSSMAEGSAYVWTDPPPTWLDISVQVRLTEAMALDAMTVSSLVVHGEGMANTYAAPSPGASPGYGGPPYQSLGLFQQLEGHLGEELCPDWETGYPPTLYLTYEGTADGQPFAGTAPGNQCATGSP